MTAGGMDEKLKVFVSYSRADLEFADLLVDMLELSGFQPIIDRHGISGGEDWKKRLGALIAEADTIVFVMSPASAKSDTCTWEVAESDRLAKRLIPIICRPLGDVKPPARLADLNYIFFYKEEKAPESGFVTGRKKLVEALNTDLDWLREATRYTERAAEWERGARAENRLLSGSDIEIAKQWIARRPAKAPDILPLVRDFIRESEATQKARDSAEAQRLKEMQAAQESRAEALAEAEAATNKQAQTARKVVRATLIGGIVTLVFAVAAGIAGYLATVNQQKAVRQAEIANQQKQEAEKQTARAETQKKEARRQAERARIARDDAQLARSRFLADLSETELQEQRPDKALALAIEAVKVSPKDSEPNAEAARAYLAATNVYNNLTFKPDLRLVGHEGTVRGVAYSREKNLALTWSGDRTARVWNGITGETIAILKHDAGVMQASFAAKGDAVVTKELAGPVRLWRGVGFAEQKTLSERAASQYLLPPSADSVYVWDDSPTMVAWDVRTGAAIARLSQESAAQDAKLDANGEHLLTYSKDKKLHVWEAKTGKELCSTSYDSEIINADFTPDGRNAWSLTQGGNLTFVGATDCTRVAEGASEIENAKSVAAQGRILAWGKNGVNVWDNTGAKIETFTTTHANKATFLDAIISSDNKFTLAWMSSGKFFLWRKGEAQPNTEGELSGTINGGTFRADSKEMAIWSSSGSVELWVLSGDKKAVNYRTLKHDDSVERVTFWGENVTSRSLDGTYRVWHRSGLELGRWTFDGPITSAVIANQGRILVGSADGSAILLRWDRLGQGQIVKHPDNIKDYAFSADGSLLVSWSKDGTIQSTPLLPGGSRQPTKLSLPPISGVSVSTSGDLIAAWHGNSIWFGSFDGQAPVELSAPGEVAALKFDRDASVALVKLTEGTHSVVRKSADRRWGMAEGVVRGDFVGLVGRQRDILLTISGGQLSFRSLLRDRLISSLPIAKDTYEVTAAEAADIVVVKVGTDSLLVYDAKTGNLMPGGSLAFGTIAHAISDDGSRLATLDRVGGWTIWSLEGNVRRSWRNPLDGNGLRLAPGGKRVLIKFSDGLELWDLDRFSLISSISRTNLKDARFSNDGRYIITEDGFQVDLWDGVSGAWLGRIENVGFKTIVSPTGQAVAWIRTLTEAEIRHVALKLTEQVLNASQSNQPITTSLSKADKCRAKINSEPCPAGTIPSRENQMMRNERVTPEIAARDIGAR